MSKVLKIKHLEELTLAWNLYNGGGDHAVSKQEGVIFSRTD